MKMKIACSTLMGNSNNQTSNYWRYIQWLQTVDANIDVIDLSEIESFNMEKVIRECDGLILTGGGDVMPSRYGKSEELHRCQHVSEERDNHEFELLEIARKLTMPILGICRGAQVLNVAYGGTLVVDIPSDISSEIIHNRVDSEDSNHTIFIEPSSLFRRYVGVMEGAVNSAHHQSVEYISPFFSIVATSADGVVEAFEVAESTAGSSFLLGVQWHPERMEFDNPLSSKIARQFLFECETYYSLLKGKPYVSLIERTQADTTPTNDENSTDFPLPVMQ